MKHETGHISVLVAGPSEWHWEVLGRKYPIMTCLSPAIQASLSLFEVSVLDWSEIAQIAHERSHAASSSTIVAPNDHDPQMQVVRGTGVCPSFLFLRLLYCEGQFRRSCQVSKEGFNHVLILYIIYLLYYIYSSFTRVWIAGQSSAKRSEMFYKHIYCCADRSNKNISPHLIVNNILY